MLSGCGLLTQVTSICSVGWQFTVVVNWIVKLGWLLWRFRNDIRNFYEDFVSFALLGLMNFLSPFVSRISVFVFKDHLVGDTSLFWLGLKLSCFRKYHILFLGFYVDFILFVFFCFDLLVFFYWELKKVVGNGNIELIQISHF